MVRTTVTYGQWALLYYFCSSNCSNRLLKAYQWRSAFVKHHKSRSFRILLVICSINLYLIICNWSLQMTRARAHTQRHSLLICTMRGDERMYRARKNPDNVTSSILHFFFIFLYSIVADQAISRESMLVLQSTYWDLSTTHLLAMVAFYNTHMFKAMAANILHTWYRKQSDTSASITTNPVDQAS